MEQKDPKEIESYVITKNFPSITTGVSVMKADFPVIINPAENSGREVVHIQVVVKKIDTRDGALVYQDPFLVHHPKILPHLHWEKDKIHYIVAPFMKLGSVKDVLPLFRFGMDERHIALIVKEIAEAISVIHKEPEVRLHRDIKLGNILIDTDEAFPVKLSNSFYQPNSSSLKIIDALHDVPYWIPPEQQTESYKTQFADSPNMLIKSDIWSLGIVTLELACGGPPVAAVADCTSKEVFDRIGSRMNFRTSSKRKRLSEKFRIFVTDCLARDPSDRPNIDTLLHYEFLASDSVSTSEDLIQTVLVKQMLKSTSERICHWVLDRTLLMRPKLYDHSE